MSRGLSGWSFKDQHVDPAIKLDQYITYETSLISFGPPNVSDLAVAATGIIPETDSRTIGVYPAGLVENFTYGGGLATQKIFEIGSVRSYLITGRPDGQATFSRILFHGPSLLRSMYAAYKDRRGLFDSLVGNTAPGVGTIDVGNTAPGTVNAGGDPGHDFFFNLQNMLFRQPFGTLLFMRDTKGIPYAGLYFEICLLSTHGFGTSAGTLNIMEAASMQFDRISPVQVRFISG